jgi:hypothetical protein
MIIIHPLSSLSLTALDLISSADTRATRAMGIDTPVFNARMNIALFSRWQVWDSIVAVGDTKEPSCLRARRFEILIHIRCVCQVASPRFAEGVQCDMLVCSGQLASSYCCHRRTQTGSCTSVKSKNDMDKKRVWL